MQVNQKITFFVPDFQNPIETSFITSEIKAGFPSPAADFEESKVSLDHMLIKNKEATFYAKASGTSMIGAGIDDGDILVIDRSLEPRIMLWQYVLLMESLRLNALKKPMMLSF